MKIVKNFQLKIVIFKAVKYRCILHGACFRNVKQWVQHRRFCGFCFRFGEIITMCALLMIFESKCTIWRLYFTATESGNLL